MTAFEIGTVIRMARKSQLLTQAQLATEAGLSRQTLIQLESGEYNEMGIKKVMSVLSVLNLKLQVDEDTADDEDDEHESVTMGMEEFHLPSTPRARPRM